MAKKQPKPSTSRSPRGTMRDLPIQRDRSAKVKGGKKLIRDHIQKIRDYAKSS